ncbi:Transglutaminase-like superfamily protein [Flavobacterium caeni]|uniref:Transglutaminase-like superfamily protein n=2 Tax=Flavobacterium caeni TaxID=490189 RepID=A0A1G5IVK9_9FLAO|nr:Transglutaminase-like superfamily protein [Flavobacterium caeni]
MFDRWRVMTKNLETIVLLLLVSVSAWAQDYARVDNLVKTYPKSFSNPKKLAAQINQDFTTETDKVRAAYTWIALNINYDLKAYQSGESMVAYTYSSPADRLAKEQAYRGKIGAKTLRTKKGVCQDYSALFHLVCDDIGVKCIDIMGTSKAHPAQIGKLPKASDHQWNAVKVGDNWKLIDVTWASGSVDTQTGKFVTDFNPAYFFTDPNVFFLNHFPDDKRLLMIDKTEQDFAALPLYYGPYIKSNYEFASPEFGIILIAKTSVIPFQIIDFPGGRISYAFTSEGRVRDIDPVKKGNATEFSIALNARSRGYLTIYVDQMAVVTYKIER